MLIEILLCFQEYHFFSLGIVLLGWPQDGVETPE